MNIKQAEFITSAVQPAQFPEVLPAIALAGKSNVGKSSFINAVCNNARLAKISGQPGKTRLVNFFKLNDAFYLVDLPGYGYAKVSREEKNKWSGMMDSFFSYYADLRLIIHIIDIRHDPGKFDVELINWMIDNQIPFILLANKADKLGKTRIKPRLKEIAKFLSIDEQYIYPFSAQDDIGREKMLEIFDEVIFESV
jgi:GTP-binding protein